MIPKVNRLKIRHVNHPVEPNDYIATLFEEKEDYYDLPLKSDHERRPIWVCADSGTILLEAYSDVAEQAQDFLIAIAEPVSRPTFIHEYRLSPYSLYAAISVGLKRDDIVRTLDMFSKTPLPKAIIEFIHSCTQAYGKVKLVLKKNRYFLESTDEVVMRKLIQDEVIKEARLADVQGKQEDTMTDVNMTKPSKMNDEHRVLEENVVKAYLDRDDAEELEDEDEKVHSFQIQTSFVEIVKRRCTEIEFPVLEEYDFRQDTQNANLDIDLRPITVIRPYQEQSLSKMFGNGRARSGVIVLPCGAGKTLVGITAACTIKKSVLVLCTSSYISFHMFKLSRIRVSVMQWKQQFLMWSTLREDQIAVFTADQREQVFALC